MSERGTQVICHQKGAGGGGDSQKQLAYRGSSEQGMTDSKELDVDTNAETWTAARHRSPAERVYEGPDWVLSLNKGKVTDERTAALHVHTLVTCTPRPTVLTPI